MLCLFVLVGLVKELMYSAGFHVSHDDRDSKHRSCHLNFQRITPPKRLDLRTADQAVAYALQMFF